MASAVVANVSCGVSVVIGVLWWVAITASWNWLSSQSILVGFQANLMTIYTSKGAATSLFSFVGKTLGASEKMNKFDKMMERSLWYEDALTEFCGTAMEVTFQWCANWTMVTYASWAMFVMGVLTSVLLLTGAGFMYYYSNVHATETGRMFCRTCFAGAPIVAVLGMLIFTLFTWEFGRDELKVFQSMKVQAMYGKGYIIAWLLTMMSFGPLYMTMVFFREDPLEKKQGGAGDEERQLTSAYGAQQYYGGQAQQYGMQQGYGEGYGQAPQCGSTQPGMQQGYAEGYGQAPQYGSSQPGMQQGYAEGYGQAPQYGSSQPGMQQGYAEGYGQAPQFGSTQPGMQQGYAEGYGQAPQYGSTQPGVQQEYAGGYAAPTAPPPSGGAAW